MKILLVILVCLLAFCALDWGFRWNITMFGQTKPVVVQQQPKPVVVVVPKPAVVAEPTNHIKVTTAKVDRPKFEREYKVALDGGFLIEVTVKFAYGERYWSSAMLRQGNGRYMFYDVKAVADRIIDKDLYPRVQKATDEILALDAAFLESNPSEFTDETGTEWRKVQ